jgi:luciferase-type oxidoreductase
VLLGALTARTSRILLGTAAIAAPVRHPLHIAKGALSVAAASGGRFILGLGSGDRLPEFAAFGRDPERRGEIFRDAWTRVAAGIAYDQRVQTDTDEPGTPSFVLRPAPPPGGVPMVAVGSAQQTLGWIARNAGAWLTYYRAPELQRDRIALWHDAVDRLGQPGLLGLGTSFQLELLEKPNATPEPLPLGLRTGTNGLREALREQKAMCVHHILFNIASGSRPVADTLHALSDALSRSALA